MCQNRTYYADKAVQLKMFGGYNCSQAVTAALGFWCRDFRLLDALRK